MKLVSFGPHTPTWGIVSVAKGILCIYMGRRAFRVVLRRAAA